MKKDVRIERERCGSDSHIPIYYTNMQGKSEYTLLGGIGFVKNLKREMIVIISYCILYSSKSSSFGGFK